MKRINIAAPQFSYDKEDPEGFTGDPETDVMVRRESGVDYFDGEA